jgi:hypothetical protein
MARPTPSSPSAPTPPPADAWASTDPLGETLHSFRLEGVVYARSHLTAPWGVVMPPMPDCVMFHIVTSGECRLEFADTEPAVLRPGEFALMPRGEGHLIMHGKGARTVNYFDLPIERVTPRYEVLTYGGGGDETTLICGGVRIDHPAARDLIELLPSLIHIKTWNTPNAEWMHSTLRLMAAEASSRQPGGETIVTRLADILVIQAIRTWLVEHPESRRGWLGALNDERIGPRHPAHPPRADARLDGRLARVLGLDVEVGLLGTIHRTCRRAGDAVPHALADACRGYLAPRVRHDLRRVCVKLGYNSEAAFNRAFKRVMGEPPGAWQASAAVPSA